MICLLLQDLSSKTNNKDGKSNETTLFKQLSPVQCDEMENASIETRMPSLQKQRTAASKNPLNGGIFKQARMCDKPANFAKKSLKRKISLRKRSSNFETAVSKLEKIAELTNSEEDQYTQFEKKSSARTASADAGRMVSWPRYH